jgi:hypothetical protein
VTPARTNLGAHARLRCVLFDRGVLAGAALWGLTQQGIGFVVPAKANRAVTAAAQALAAAGAGLVARRVHPVGHGQGQHRWTARLETEVVGLPDWTTSDQYGPEEHAQQRYRKDFEGHPLNAVVVRQWHSRDDGPGREDEAVGGVGMEPRAVRGTEGRGAPALRRGATARGHWGDGAPRGSDRVGRVVASRPVCAQASTSGSQGAEARHAGTPRVLRDAQAGAALPCALAPEESW